MKLKNRIMSWLLSPGAYALWHSMGNAEEWRFVDDGKEPYFKHEGSGLKVRMDLWWRLPVPCYLIPPLWIVVALSWALWPVFAFECEGHDDGLGFWDRQLIAGKAMRLRGKRVRINRTARKRKANQDIFTLLTVNEVAK